MWKLGMILMPLPRSPLCCYCTVPGVLSQVPIPAYGEGKETEWRGRGRIALITSAWCTLSTCRHFTVRGARMYSLLLALRGPSTKRKPEEWLLGTVSRPYHISIEQCKWSLNSVPDRQLVQISEYLYHLKSVSGVLRHRGIMKKSVSSGKTGAGLLGKLQWEPTHCN